MKKNHFIIIIFRNDSKYEKSTESEYDDQGFWVDI